MKFEKTQTFDLFFFFFEFHCGLSADMWEGQFEKHENIQNILCKQ